MLMKISTCHDPEVSVGGTQQSAEVPRYGVVDVVFGVIAIGTHRRR